MLSGSRGPNEGGGGLDLGLVRFYLDDETVPRLAIPWADVFRGDRAPFVAPLVTEPGASTGAFVSWVPVPYAHRLLVTTERRPSFYRAHYETFSPDTVVTSFDGCTAEASRDAFRAALDSERSNDVESVALDLTRTGAGTLDVIRFQPDAAPTEAALQSARLRITWDDDSVPAVDAPLGAFFGLGLGPARIRALPLWSDGLAFESRFRMPFWSGFHLSVRGLSGSLGIHVGPARYDRAEAGYFHALASSALPTLAGQDFEYAAPRGAGKLVGTVLTVQPASATTKKWWEGDLRSYENGRRTPSIQGTGHEDDHLASWSSTLFEGPFSLPLQGEPSTTILDTSGQVNADATFYRFYPGIEFLDGARHSTEHGSRNSVQSDYRGVAFYYADASGTLLVETDRIDPPDPISRRNHAYSASGESSPTLLSSSFEGRDDRTVVARETIDQTGAAEFHARVDTSNAGCFLRRTYDQRNGRQRALVRIDGVEVGVWYTADSNATHRWAERDYFVPPRHTGGKHYVRVGIERTSALRRGPSRSTECSAPF